MGTLYVLSSHILKIGIDQRCEFVFNRGCEMVKCGQMYISNDSRRRPSLATLDFVSLSISLLKADAGYASSFTVAVVGEAKIGNFPPPSFPLAPLL
jgi:hypothetical protein